MKRFGGKRPLDEILKNAKKQGFAIDTTRYNAGRDYVMFTIKYESGILTTGYNTFNGNFFGSYGNIEFTNAIDTYDNEPRMNILFDLFYFPPKEETLGV